VQAKHTAVKAAAESAAVYSGSAAAIAARDYQAGLSLLGDKRAVGISGGREVSAQCSTVSSLVATHICDPYYGKTAVISRKRKDQEKPQCRGSHTSVMHGCAVIETSCAAITLPGPSGTALASTQLACLSAQTLSSMPITVKNYRGQGGIRHYTCQVRWSFSP
jgi:hypothetical protein